MEYVRRVNRVWTYVRRHGFDALIALLAAEGMLEVALRGDSTKAPTTTLWFAIPAIGVMVLPLFARRRFPLVAPSAYWLVAAGVTFVDGRLIPFVESLFVLGMAVSFLLGHLRDSVRARAGLAIVVGGAAIVVYNIPDHTPSEQVFIPLLFAVAWLAGFALRERAAQAEAAEVRAFHAEREREAAARIAVAEERARIARELHDVVAHAVSVMVLQVGAVRHRLPGALAEDRAALDDVERAGRTALAEMRHLLGAMRRNGEDAELTPQPGLDGLESLLEKVRSAGLPVGLHVDGERVPLPRALDLSAYRIVQEGLTNALKHAGAGQAEVVVSYDADELRIEVRDDGEGGAPSDGLGHGLIGVRERVKIYGGAMNAEADPDGGFVLSASLPLGGERP